MSLVRQLFSKKKEEPTQVNSHVGITEALSRPQSALHCLNKIEKQLGLLPDREWDMSRVMIGHMGVAWHLKIAAEVKDDVLLAEVRNLIGDQNTPIPVHVFPLRDRVKNEIKFLKNDTAIGVRFFQTVAQQLNVKSVRGIVYDYLNKNLDVDAIESPQPPAPSVFDRFRRK